MTKVLIIDDNVDNAQTLAWAMEAAGYDTYFITNSTTAFNDVLHKIPDVILCDISMPGMNGYELCRQFKADKRFKDTLFIAQTAYSTIDKKMRSVDAGFQYHFVKPLDLPKLLETLSSAFASNKKLAIA